MSKTTKTTTQTETTGARADVYTRVTDRIVADLERGVRTWLKPWSADHASDRPASLPMRHNGTPRATSGASGAIASGARWHLAQSARTTA